MRPLVAVVSSDTFCAYSSSATCLLQLLFLLLPVTPTAFLPAKLICSLGAVLWFGSIFRERSRNNLLRIHSPSFPITHVHEGLRSYSTKYAVDRFGIRSDQSRDGFMVVVCMSWTWLNWGIYNLQISPACLWKLASD